MNASAEGQKQNDRSDQVHEIHFSSVAIADNASIDRRCGSTQKRERDRQKVGGSGVFRRAEIGQRWDANSISCDSGKSPVIWWWGVESLAGLVALFN